MSRGGGRAASQVGGRGGMSRGGKRRSPRTAKKTAPRPTGASTEVADNKEGDRHSTQEQHLRTPASPEAVKRRVEEDLDDPDSMRTSSQTVNYIEGPSSKQQHPNKKTNPKRRVVTIPSDLENSEDSVDKIVPKVSSKPVKSRSTTGQKHGEPVMRNSKSGQLNYKRSHDEENRSEGDSVKKRRVNDGRVSSQDNRGTRNGHERNEERAGTDSARSGQSRRPPPRLVSSRDPPSGSMSNSQYGEIVNLLHDLNAQNRHLTEVLETIVKKLDTPTRNNPSPKVKSEVVEMPVTPKRAFEDTMHCRIGGIDTVFNDDQFSVSAKKIIPRYILSLVDRQQNCIPIEKVPKLLNSFLFSVPREMKGPLNVTDAGAACSFLRRSIIKDCFRTGPKLFSKVPHWLSTKMVGDRQVPHMNEKDLNLGIDRRERCRGKNVDGDSKRRRGIAVGTVEPTPADEAEYIGWWAYGQLASFFNKCRRNAIALLFEHVTFLFVPWCWSTGDRRSSDSTGRQGQPGNGGMRDSVIDDILSKKSLRIEWVTDSSSNSGQPKSIPLAKIYGDVEQCDDDNHALFMAIAKREEDLQLNVEHDVLIHKSAASKKIRQRKGQALKTFTRRLSLMDSAAQFMIGFTGGDRTMSSHEVMKYTKKSLQAIVFLASAFRDIMEHGTGDIVRGPYGAIARPRKAITTEIAKEMAEMFSKMIPNDQIQGRVFNRQIWSVPEDIYKSGHCYGLMNAGIEEVDDSGAEDLEGMEAEAADEDDLLMDEEDDDDQQEHLPSENPLEDDRLRGDQDSAGYGSKSLTIASSGAAAMPPPSDDDDDDDMAGDPTGERQGAEEPLEDDDEKYVEQSDDDGENS